MVDLGGEVVGFRGNEVAAVIQGSLDSPEEKESDRIDAQKLPNASDRKVTDHSIEMVTNELDEDYKNEAEVYFILFLTFMGLSIITIATLLYLISKMRQFVSVRKSLLTSIESRESRISPQGLPSLNKRPIVKSTNPSVWVIPHGSQLQ